MLRPFGFSNYDPLDLVQAEFILGPVIKISRARGFVTCDPLGSGEIAAIGEKCRDPGGAEGVAADFFGKANILSSALDNS